MYASFPLLPNAPKTPLKVLNSASVFGYSEIPSIVEGTSKLSSSTQPVSTTKLTKSTAILFKFITKFVLNLRHLLVS